MNGPLTQLANHYHSDKGTVFLDAHGYTRVYDALFAPLRHTPIHLLEIGLLHGLVQTRSGVSQFSDCPSLRMWRDYFPLATLYGLDIADFSAVQLPGTEIIRGDQGQRSDLAKLGELLARHGSGGFDVIIDDGSHASHHQQISLATLFPLLKPGGLYIIEDLHYQPVELERPGITKTRALLQYLRHRQGTIQAAISQQEFDYLLEHTAELGFFDSLTSNYPITQTADALAVLVKRAPTP